MDAYDPDETNDKTVTRISLACSQWCMLGKWCASKVLLTVLRREVVAGAACQGETQPLQGACNAAQHGLPVQIWEQVRGRAVSVIHSRPRGTQESKHWFSEWEFVFPPLRGKQHVSSFLIPVAKLWVSPVLARWSAQSKDRLSPFLRGSAKKARGICKYFYSSCVSLTCWWSLGMHWIWFFTR